MPPSSLHPPFTMHPDRAISEVSAIGQHIPGAYPDNNNTTTTSTTAAATSTQPQARTSTQQTLTQALYARRADFTRRKTLRLKVGTWNVAANKAVEKDVGGWFVGGQGVTEHLAGLEVNKQVERKREGVGSQEWRHRVGQSTLPLNDGPPLPVDEDIGLYVLGLQEVVDIASPAEALRPYTDPAVAKRWKEAVAEALPGGFRLVAEQQLIGLLLLVYAAPELVDEVGSVGVTSLGTGLMGYLGNKGATTVRIVLGETTRLLFVNCHLAAGADKGAVDRRNWDVGQIMMRTRFDPIVDPGGETLPSGDRIGDEDFAFWFGDLNYRLEGMPGDDVRRLLELHVRNEYDVGRYKSSGVSPAAFLRSLDTARDTTAADDSSQLSSASAAELLSPRTDQDSDREPLSPSDDPASLVTTIASLLPHDELHQMMRSRKAFHDGWREGLIRFLPTYKYDVGSVGVFDSSEKRRAPSWCDRILFRTRRDRIAYEKKFRDQEQARKRDEELKAQGVDQASNEENVLFDYDPGTDGADEDDYDDFAELEPAPTVSAENYEDEITVERYNSHQRVLSSDHKPLSAIFVLKYDAVIPELKAKVHAEVAREMDRTENETRPAVTLIADPPQSSGGDNKDGHGEGAIIDFGHVRYAETIHRSLIAANTGQVEATISFVDRPQSNGIAPRWLSIHVEHSAGAPDRLSYTLQPGDTLSVDLVLQVVDLDLIPKLNSGDQDLSDILVLRVGEGRDHFVPIRGQWQATCLCRSIAELVRVPVGGIRKLQANHSPSTNNVQFSAPRELFRLTEALEHAVERSVAEWDMTAARSQASDSKPPWEKNAGWPFSEDSWTSKSLLTSTATASPDNDFLPLKSALIDALDTDQSLDSAIPPSTSVIHRTEAVASTLLTFLTSLTDGIIPSDLWTQLDTDLQARERDKAKTKSPQTLDDQRTFILEALSAQPNHSISFVILTSSLTRVVQELTSPPATTTTKATTNSTSTASTTPSSSANAAAAGTSAATTGHDNDSDSLKSKPPEITMPSSPKGASVRRRTLSKVPHVARRQLVEKSVAGVLARFVARFPAGMREKERRAAEERVAAVLDVFVRDERGE